MYAQFRTTWQTAVHSVTQHTRRTVVLSKLSLVSLALVTASVVPMIAFPGTAHADTGCGSIGIALSGSSWLSGGGVNVCNHPGDGSHFCLLVSGAPGDSKCPVNYVWSGDEWQCVEMVNRLYLSKGWTTATWYGDG